MAWLHTWAGLLVGALLFAIFWMGSLSVFDREIDRWMMPATRLPSHPELSLAEVERQAAHLIKDKQPVQLYVLPPTARTPIAKLGIVESTGKLTKLDLDPRTGTVLDDSGTLGATGFLYPFHNSLNLSFFGIGYWIVGFAGMTMLALVASGLVIHRRIFADFFMFRPGKSQRMVLDLHNIAGVFGLPFHAIITLSGLIIFFAIYWPGIWSLAGGRHDPAFRREAFGLYSRPPAQACAARPTLSFDAARTEAAALWGGQRPSFLRVWYPGDAASYIELRPTFEDRMAIIDDTLYLDAATGEVLFLFKPTPIVHAMSVIGGLHMVLFQDWSLRWLYFVSGLLGCATIATGMLFWLQRRKKRYAARLPLSARLVQSLTVGATTGIVIATLVFLGSDRLLPASLPRHAALEIWAFFGAWMLTFLHGAGRWTQAVWRGQLRAMAGLALAAVCLNAISTGDDLLRSVTHSELWSVAGVDVMLLVLAALSLYCSRLFGRHARDAIAVQVADVGDSP